MFIATFTQIPADNEKFTPSEATGQMPFIGEVKYGTYTSAIMNDTLFNSGKYEEGKPYACENYVEDWLNPDTGVVQKQHRVRIVMPITGFSEMIEAAKFCGPIVNKIPKSVVITEEERANAEKLANDVPAFSTGAEVEED